MKKLRYFAILLSCTVMFSCGGDADNGDKTDTDRLKSSEQTNIEDPSISESFSWDNIPVYAGAVLESTTDCAAKWAECEKCEHRIYVTDDDPKVVCTFYKKVMEKKGWNKIVYQAYPEGSCLGTWLSADSETRVFLNVAQRRSDRKIFVAITMGKGCPN